MGFCLKLATLKKGGGLPLLRATKIFQNAPRGLPWMCTSVYLSIFWARGRKFGVSCFKSDGSLHAYLMLLFHISGVAGTRWPKGLAYNDLETQIKSNIFNFWPKIN